MLWRIRFEIRCFLRRYSERAQMFVAWHTPRWLVKWIVVRAFAQATTIEPNAHPDEVGYSQVCKAVDTL